MNYSELPEFSHEIIVIRCESKYRHKNLDLRFTKSKGLYVVTIKNIKKGELLTKFGSVIHKTGCKLFCW